MTFRDSAGAPISLAGKLGAGGEAEIFGLVQRADVVAKIYHHPDASGEREAKLRAMVSNAPVDPTAHQGHRSICWPESLLFDSGKRCVGFLMPRIDTARNLPVFKLYHPHDRQRLAPGFNWQYLLRTSVNICSVVSAIHDRGCVVGDLNESNIFIGDSALVALVDCDSMQVPKLGASGFYRCAVGKPDYTPPELQGHNFRDVDRGSEHDSFGLAVLIFQLLMEGTHPFSGVWRGAGDPPSPEEKIRRGLSPYANARLVSPMPTAPPFAMLHPALRALFERCFREGHSTPTVRPSPRDWAHALTEAEADLVTCSKSSAHKYLGHLSQCPWCKRSALLRGFDSFAPAPHQRPLATTPFARIAAVRSVTPPTVPTAISARPAAAPQPVAPPATTRNPTGSQGWLVWGLMLMALILVPTIFIGTFREPNARKGVDKGRSLGAPEYIVDTGSWMSSIPGQVATFNCSLETSGGADSHVLRLEMSTPHPWELGVKTPSGRFFWLVGCDDWMRVEPLKSLSCEAFSGMEVLELHIQKLTLQSDPIFNEAGVYTISMSRNLETTFYGNRCSVDFAGVSPGGIDRSDNAHDAGGIGTTVDGFGSRRTDRFGEDVFRVGGSVLAPKLIKKIEPEYSRQARDAKLQGKVILKVEVWPDGRAHNVRVARGLGLGLDEKAVEAIQRWEFEPGTNDGVPVKVAASVEVHFQLLPGTSKIDSSENAARWETVSPNTNGVEGDSSGVDNYRSGDPNSVSGIDVEAPFRLPSPPPDPIARLLTEAEQKIARRDYDGALADAQSAVRIAPSDMRATALLERVRRIRAILR